MLTAQSDAVSVDDEPKSCRQWPSNMHYAGSCGCIVCTLLLRVCQNTILHVLALGRKVSRAAAIFSIVQTSGGKAVAKRITLCQGRA